MHNSEFRNQQTFLEKHSQEINKLIKPLHELFGVQFFSHHRYYRNKQFFLICNNPSWTKYYYIQELYCVKQGLPNITKTGIYFNDDYPTDTEFHNKIIEPLKKHFYTDHLIYIVKQHTSYTDVYILGATPDNLHFNRHFLMNIDFFNNFLLFYKDKAKTLINLAKNNLINLKITTQIELVTSKSDTLKLQLEKAKKDYTASRYYLDGKFSHIYLTLREAECLVLLNSGQRYVEIANQLAISIKTVQFHIKNIYEKFQCNKKSSLLKILRENHIVEYINGKTIQADSVETITAAVSYFPVASQPMLLQYA